MIRYVITYLFFLFFIAFMVSMGSPLFLGEVGAFTPPDPPDTSGWGAIINVVVWSVQNIAFFFRLMGISTTVRWVGILILSPLILGMFWVLLSLIRGVG